MLASLSSVEERHLSVLQLAIRASLQACDATDLLLCRLAMVVKLELGMYTAVASTQPGTHVCSTRHSPNLAGCVRAACSTA